MITILYQLLCSGQRKCVWGTWEQIKRVDCYLRCPFGQPIPRLKFPLEHSLLRQQAVMASTLIEFLLVCGATWWFWKQLVGLSEQWATPSFLSDHPSRHLRSQFQYVVLLHLFDFKGHFIAKIQKDFLYTPPWSFHGVCMCAFPWTHVYVLDLGSTRAGGLGNEDCTESIAYNTQGKWSQEMSSWSWPSQGP